MRLHNLGTFTGTWHDWHPSIASKELRLGLLQQVTGKAHKILGLRWNGDSPYIANCHNRTLYSSKMTGSDPTIAIGIILVGTCPGGWLSNIFSVLLDVDFVLSVTMTFFSSVIAMGMMPLNLLIYATPYTKGNARLQTPFKDLIIQLILLVVPCFIGIALRAKFPKWAPLFKRLFNYYMVIHSFIYMFIYLFIYLFIHLFICLFIYRFNTYSYIYFYL